MKLADIFCCIAVVGVFGLPLAVWKAWEIIGWIFEKI